MAKEKRPAWFKIYLHQKALLDAMPDEVVGRAMKAAMDYFESGCIPKLAPLETAVFATFQPFIQEAKEEYMVNVENGKRGAEKKKALRDAKPPLAPLREEEKEKEEDKEEDKEKEKEKESRLPPATPLSPFIPPKLQEVAAYCKEKSYNIDPRRFVDYYESIGWQVGKSQMKDWKAAVRNWNSTQKKEQKNGKTDTTPHWTVGTVL